MVSIEFLKTTPNKMDAIDMKAIARLRNYLETEIYMNNLDISESSLLNENNYIIIEIEGYENIAFRDHTKKYILETVQPIDRKESQLFPIQRIEIKAQYKRY